MAISRYRESPTPPEQGDDHENAKLLVAGGVTLAMATPAAADDAAFFEVTVTNATAAQSFTPILVATHASDSVLFRLGEPASAELAVLAEGGDTAPLAAALAQNNQVLDVQSSSGLLAPGQSSTLRVATRGRFKRVSVAAMLIPTNDSFLALNGMRGPSGSDSITVFVPAYDAGSEPNDNRCVSIPGPVCGGEGTSPNAGGEGFVHISRGTHGNGDLDPAVYDWRNPVARITVRRVAH
ncbi:MAG: spondin domain-containing protein [Burkholderiales bacterium]